MALCLNRTKKLPAVFPLVLYNGQRPWNSALSLRDLKRLKNLAASLFQLEVSASHRQAGEAVQALIEALTQPEHSTLITAFVNMLNKSWFEAHLPGQDIKEIQSLGECKTMLAENVRNWTQNWKEEGLKAGRKEGESEVLKRQLKIKFGELPEWVIEKLKQCSTNELETLSERIFEAQTVEEFFK